MTLADRDRLALYELAGRYALYADQRRLADLSQLFTVDAELLLPDPPDRLGPVRRMAGRDEILAALGSLTEVPVTRHAITGHVVDAGAVVGTAGGTVTGTAHHVTDRPDGRCGNLVWYVRYHDEYCYGAGAWRLSRRAMEIDWIETRPVRTRRTGDTDTVRS